jgi:hypothetical protein
VKQLPEWLPNVLGLLLAFLSLIFQLLLPPDFPYHWRLLIVGALLMAAGILFRRILRDIVVRLLRWCYDHSLLSLTILLALAATISYSASGNLLSVLSFLFLYIVVLILRFGREEIPSRLPLTFVRVPARESGGIDTQIDISLGQKIIILAFGEISFDNGQAWCTASGIITRPLQFANRTYPAPNSYIDSEPAGALIGWIGQGNQGKAFLVGEFCEKVATEMGHLFLAVNDVRGAYVDNIGSFSVQIFLPRSYTASQRTATEEVREYCRARRQELAEYVAREPDDAKARYEIAEYQARLLDNASALYNLERAIELGEGYREKAKKSSAFEKLRDDTRFKELVGE